MIGAFEYLILTAKARLGEEAYSEPIRQTTQPDCSIGALYTTLDRLEKKGLIKAWVGDPTPEREGLSEAAGQKPCQRRAGCERVL
jgi:DNA-binding PadR family transcriptional regulator